MSRRLPTLIAGLAFAISACGADTAVESTGTASGLPDGTWQVSQLMVAEPTDLPAEPIRFQFVNVGASMRIDTGCHRLFGSYTFEDDGAASFTVPGISTNECAPAAQALEDTLLAVLQSVSSWEGSQQALILLSPSGRLELVPSD